MRGPQTSPAQPADLHRYGATAVWPPLPGPTTGILQVRQRRTGRLGSRAGHIPRRALGPAFYFGPSRPPSGLVGPACCVCLCLLA